MDFKIATREHAVLLSRSMRESDVKEVWSSNHLKPFDAIYLSIMASYESYSVFDDDGNLIIIFGFAKRINNYGAIPWMLASDYLNVYPVTFYKQSKKHISKMIKKYKFLENYVDVRNELSIRWLSWLGFILEDEKPYGPDNMPFRRFYMRGDE